MARRKKKSNGAAIFLVILTIIVIFSYVTVKNFFRFETISQFGISQYLSNIIHLHDTYYCTALVNLKIYPRIIPVRNIDEAEFFELESDSIFKFEGYKSFEEIDWIAATIYLKNKKIDGYFVIPEHVPIQTFQAKLPFVETMFQNKYFQELDISDLQVINQIITEEFFSCLKENKLKIQYSLKGMDKQRIRELNEFKVIEFLSNNTEIQYCASKDYDQILKIYDLYLGSNYETHLLQTDLSYDPLIDGPTDRSFLFTIISSVYFKLTIFLIIILMVLFTKFKFRN